MIWELRKKHNYNHVLLSSSVILSPGLTVFTSLSLVVPSESLGSFYNRKHFGNALLLNTLSSHEVSYLGISRPYNCLTVEIHLLNP